MRKNTFLIAVMLMIAFCNPVSGQYVKYNNIVLDTQDEYEISFGPTIEGYLGQDNLIVPIRLTNEEPVEYIHLLITYDPGMIMPTVAAPAFFVQHFNYDLSVAGQIEIELECNLIPPPYIPPIPAGDTVIAFILIDVVAGDPGYDISTNLTFYEDPNTPFPDNLLLLETGYFIIPPQLILTDGTIYIYSPLYGDLNLNSLPYEIGDVITFINFLSGYIEFTAQQMANSDCNRDGVPATVSDLVYMLNVINGQPDTLCGQNPGNFNPEILKQELAIFSTKSIKVLDKAQEFSIFISTEEPLGGFALSIKIPDCVTLVGDVVLEGNTADFQIVSSFNDGVLQVLGFSVTGNALENDFSRQLQASFESSCRVKVENIEIISADFSDSRGNKIDGVYEVQLFDSFNFNDRRTDQEEPGHELFTAYPNPFNSYVNFSYEIVRPGHVLLEIYDLLGRKVKTLTNSFEQEGQRNTVWNGKNEFGESVATGIYLCRIVYNQKEKVVKLHYLK